MPFLHAFSLFFCPVLFLCLVPGCSDSVPQEAKKDAAVAGGVYHSPLTQNPGSLDPIEATGFYGVHVVNQLFDGLVMYDQDLMAAPALAESWDVDRDGRRYIFHLRTDAVFHDGHPVTAKDAAYTLKRLLRRKEPSYIQPSLLHITGAKAFREGKSKELPGLKIVDDRTLVVSLNKPHASFLTSLGIYQAKVVPAHILEKNNGVFPGAPVGTGPFAFVSWEKDKRITLRRFEKYYGGPALLDKIAFHIYPGSDMDAVFADFKAGRLDETPVYGDVKQELKTMKGVNLVRRPALALLFYAFNCSRPLLDDPDFRNALSLAVDRKALVDTVYDGMFDPAYAILPPGMPGRTDKRLEYDPEKAKRLLEKSLKRANLNKAEVELASVSKSRFAQAEFAFVKKAWERIGVSLEIKYVTDWDAFIDYVDSDKAQLHRRLWRADIPDPNNFFYPLFDSAAQSNYSFYDNPKINRDIAGAEEINAPTTRAEAYQRLGGELLAQLPIMPLFYLSVDRAYKDYVRGVKLNSLGLSYFSYHKVWLDTPARHGR